MSKSLEVKILSVRDLAGLRWGCHYYVRFGHDHASPGVRTRLGVTGWVWKTSALAVVRPESRHRSWVESPVLNS